MSKGKYSPTIHNRPRGTRFIYNARGELPHQSLPYEAETHYPAYDQDGFDQYGYCAYYRDGTYNFLGGVDANGFTEDDYILMDDHEYEAHVRDGWTRPW